VEGGGGAGGLHFARSRAFLRKQNNLLIQNGSDGGIAPFMDGLCQSFGILFSSF
jgi:hypothetical protein